MIKTFKDQASADIFTGANTKEARKALPQSLVKIAQRKLDQLDNAVMLSDLSIPPANHLEKLKEDLADYYSIRINEQYRVVFQWNDENQPENVYITDYH